MNRRKISCAVIIMGILFIVFAVQYQACAAEALKAKWTYMVYMDGDNDLEEFVARDIKREFGKVGSNKDVNILILADRTPGYDKSAGDWTSTKLFYVTKGMTAAPDNCIEDWEEMNMGDPQTLNYFVQYAKDYYPADRYALIMWDHGWGWHPGWTMSDDTNGGDALDPHEIVAAMKEVGPIDVIGYDACECQMIEVASYWRNYAKAMVASQPDVGGEGFMHGNILAALESNPKMNGQQLAVFMSKYMEDNSSAIALDTRFDTLKAAVSEWGIALKKGLPQNRSAYDAAYTAMQSFDCDTNKDLISAVTEINSRVKDPEIIAKGKAVVAAVKGAVMYKKHTSDYPAANGIGIFWPRYTAELDDFSYYKSKLNFSATKWDEFIAAYAVNK